MAIKLIPLDQIDSIDERIGDIWKAVANRLGHASITPAVYLPLLDHVLPRFGSWTSLTRALADELAAGTTRGRIVADIQRAELAYEIWRYRRPQLQAWANATGSSIASRSLWRVWSRGEHRRRNIDAENRIDELIEAAGIEGIDRLVLMRDPGMRTGFVKPSVRLLRRDLQWLGELETLRSVARKTWPADPGGRIGWTADDLAFVNRYYSNQSPGLDPRSGPPYDPFDLGVWNAERRLPPMADGLNAAMHVIVQTAVVDFVDELLDRSRRPTARGSLECVECGRFVGRRALGVGQLYCSELCKKRAAKRRNRRHARDRLLALGELGGSPTKTGSGLR